MIEEEGIGSFYKGAQQFLKRSASGALTLAIYDQLYLISKADLLLNWRMILVFL